MQKLISNKKVILGVVLAVAVFLVALQFLSTEEYIVVPNKDNSSENLTEYLSSLYSDYKYILPDFNKFSNEVLEVKCPLYIPDTQTFSDCLDRETNLKILNEKIPEEKIKQAESKCSEEVLYFNETENEVLQVQTNMAGKTADIIDARMFNNIYKACILFKLNA